MIVDLGEQRIVLRVCVLSDHHGKSSWQKKRQSVVPRAYEEDVGHVKTQWKQKGEKSIGIPKILSFTPPL